MKQAKWKRWMLCFGILSCVGFSGKVLAAGTSAEEVRLNHPIGAYLALWGDPFPALWGANIAYNVYDFVRLTAGVGTDSTTHVTATTFGMGAKLFVPNWALSPVVGLNWSFDNLTSGGNVRYPGNSTWRESGLRKHRFGLANNLRNKFRSRIQPVFCLRGRWLRIHQRRFLSVEASFFPS